MNKEQVQIIKGSSFTDHRGALSFVNEFEFHDVKRFYQITHPDTLVVRAWQGHQKESKYFYVAKGKFAIAYVKIDDWINPSPDLTAHMHILKESDPGILFIPPGYANGIKALEPDSCLIVYSNLTLQESSVDRWSFEPTLWLDWKKI